jgi:hypothetical protein
VRPSGPVRAQVTPGDGLSKRRRGDGPRGPEHRRRTNFFLNPFEERPAPGDRGEPTLTKGLILAQNERWRRGLGMQVVRVRPQGRASGARVSKATVTNLGAGNSRGKLRVIASDVGARHRVPTKGANPP